MKYLLSLIGIIIGCLLVIKSEWIVRNFGYINWAERYLGTEGGSRLFWKLIGILVIIICFLVISGLIEPVLLSIFSPTLRGF